MLVTLLACPVAAVCCASIGTYVVVLSERMSMGGAGVPVLADVLVALITVGAWR